MQPVKQRILCVDDDDDTCFMLTTMLEQENFETKSASTINEALHLAESSSFDLFVIDNRFPDAKGPDLCRKLKGLFPHTPLIVFSGDGYKSDCEAALEAGAAALVNKPDVDVLVQTVHRLLHANNSGD
jgi:CheY-like chemotaxis protein